MTSLRLWVLAVAALLSTGCVSELANMVTLQKDLLEQYPGTEIQVTMRERSHLQVTLLNGGTSGMSAGEQADFARSVGLRVLDHYPRAHLLHTISVGFGTAERTGPLALTRETERFNFTPAELASPGDPAAAELVEAAQSTS